LLECIGASATAYVLQEAGAMNWPALPALSVVEEIERRGAQIIKASSPGSAISRKNGLYVEWECHVT